MRIRDFLVEYLLKFSGVCHKDVEAVHEAFWRVSVDISPDSENVKRRNKGSCYSNDQLLPHSLI